jgi:hypothetical protein
MMDEVHNSRSRGALFSHSQLCKILIGGEKFQTFHKNLAHNFKFENATNRPRAAVHNTP